LNYSWGIDFSTTGLHCLYANASVYQGYDENGILKINKTYKLHRLIMGVESKVRVDHINHNTLDNRKENLRIVSIMQNAKHRESKNKNNKSGYRNVSLDKRANEWMVQLQVDGKNTCFKRFPYDKVDEAGTYAKIKREEIYGIYAGNS